MERSVDSLWRTRSSTFWRGALPYFRYIVQSGLPGVTIMLLLAGLAGYGMLLRNMPVTFPITLVGVVVLTPFICWSPLRTWLREADVVFLVPREAQLPSYLRRSFRYNSMGIMAAVLLMCGIYIPLYIATDGQTSSIIIVVAALLLKLLHMGAAWRERQLVHAGSRRSIRLLRWSATAVGVASLLHTEIWKTVMYLAVVGCLFGLLYLRMPRYPIPWLLLIEEEKGTRRRYDVFFGAFTDVPTESAAVKSRPYASWMAKRIRYRREHAFVYLYTFTLIRTELGGILLRLTGLGLFTGILSAYSGLWSGWGSAGVCMLFVWLSGVQLSALTQAHRHSVWRHVYPLPEQTRYDAVMRVDRMAALLCAIIIWLPQIVLLPSQGLVVQALTSLVLSLLYVLALRPGRVKRKLVFDPDED
ncbi:ABC transporter permease [Paenibacillus sp. CF384]|uniref:ABC transporter permease n=1 Tax=Paenibacillus sp. CF384 TaxID=1884382 RepID=UPI00089B5FA0|nr:ABC transporter permease [Paenibacillus sp. CF384]SDW82633.1 ABC-2 type transport system permease protein [Paenibacillus sp. CF384]